MNRYGSHVTHARRRRFFGMEDVAMSPAAGREAMADDPRAALVSPLSVHAADTPMPPQGATPASFKVHMWQSQRFDSGVQTMTHSQAPSMMSMTSLHAASQMSSHMSSMADDLRPELTDQQQERFSGLPSSFQNTGQPYDPGQAAQAIPELCNLMGDADDVVVYKAVSMMQHVAKMDSESHRPIITGPEVVFAIQEVLRTRSQFYNIVRAALGTIFHLCNRPEGLDNVLNVVLTNKDYFFPQIVMHINTVQHSCYKYALLTLHSLLCEKTHGKRVIELARRNNTLEMVAQWLDKENSQKLLPVIVDIVRLLLDRNGEQRAQFLKMGGASKLLHICKNHNYWNLLLRSTQLIRSLSNYEPVAVAQAGAFEVLSPQLEHENPRLVNSTLECFVNMSDVSAENIPNSMMPVLDRILALIGGFDLQMMQFCVQFLSNICANKQPNKEHLFRRRAVETLLRALCVTTADKKQSGDPQRQQMLENIQVLNKAAEQDANLPAFRDVCCQRRFDPNTQYPMPPNIFFSEQLVFILRVACMQLPSTQVVEDIKLADLIQLSLSTLQLLARERQLLHQIVVHILRPENQMEQLNDRPALLPLFALLQRTVNNEALKRSSLGCIAALTAHPNFARIFHENQHLLNVIRHYSRSDEQALKAYADQALRRILNGGDNVPMAPPYMPPQQQPYPPMEPLHMPAPHPYNEPYADYRQPMEYFDDRPRPAYPPYAQPGPPPPPQQRHHPVPRPPQASPRGETAYPSPRPYPYDTPSTSRGYSSAGSYPSWQEDPPMATEDPFVSMFCNPQDSPSFSPLAYPPSGLESAPIGSPASEMATPMQQTMPHRGPPYSPNAVPPHHHNLPPPTIVNPVKSSEVATTSSSDEGIAMILDDLQLLP